VRNIKKGAEPKSLARHRCNQNATYANYAEKDDLRKSLVAEQGGICCYCMQRIRFDDKEEKTKIEMKIEHWRSQDGYPQFQLDYQNLLGACMGAEGQPGRQQHCDTRKGKKDLSLNPAADDVERSIHFLGDGRVSSDDALFDAQLNDVLNLNADLLIRSRKQVLDAFRQSSMDKKATNADLERQLRNWNGDNGGTLEPFCQVVVYYLKKKLRKK
jgi:uncharacterized protein (TIGR02646 family)